MTEVFLQTEVKIQPGRGVPPPSQVHCAGAPAQNGQKGLIMGGISQWEKQKKYGSNYCWTVGPKSDGVVL